MNMPMYRYARCLIPRPRPLSVPCSMASDRKWVGPRNEAMFRLFSRDIIIILRETKTKSAAMLV